MYSLKPVFNDNLSLKAGFKEYMKASLFLGEFYLGCLGKFGKRPLALIEHNMFRGCAFLAP